METRIEQRVNGESCTASASSVHATPSLTCDSSYHASATDHSQSTHRTRVAVHTYSHFSLDACLLKQSLLLVNFWMKPSQENLELINISPFIFLLVWTIVPCGCAATAFSPSRIDAPDQSQQRSPTLGSSVAVWLYSGVSGHIGQV